MICAGHPAIWWVVLGAIEALVVFVAVWIGKLTERERQDRIRSRYG